MLHFHIRRLTGGQVSSALGREIRAGHRVRLTGPFGSAFFREGHAGRIVLVASGTGFAPMWSVAIAAILEQPQRELVFVVAARSIRSLYMHAALCRLALFPNVTLIPVVSEPQNISHAVRSGRPTDHLPQLTPDDVVYTAGAPAMTESVARYRESRRRPMLHRSLRAGGAELRTGHLDDALQRLVQRDPKQSDPVAAGAEQQAKLTPNVPSGRQRPERHR